MKKKILFGFIECKGWHTHLQIIDKYVSFLKKQHYASKMLKVDVDM
jgi:hypothetical protein